MVDLFDIYGSRSDDDDDNDGIVESGPQKSDPPPQQDPPDRPVAPDPPVAAEPSTGRTGGYLDGATDELPQVAGEADEQVEVEEFRRMRPYARTGGRTAPEVALGVESLIVTCPLPPEQLRDVRSEHAYLRRLCVTSTSLAEISAYMNLPIGVTRVLVSDAIQAGLVELVSSTVSSDRPPLQLMHRVLAGLQRL